MDRKGALGLALRIALSIGILVFLFLTVDFDTDELLPDWSTSTTLWLIAAAGLTLSALLLSVWRWWEVGQVLEIEDVGFSRYLAHYLAGQFLSNFVPTTVGGDVLRVRRLSKDSGQPPAAFASVVFERLSGWLILPAISLLGFALNPGLRRLETSSTLAMVVSGVTLLALGVVIAVAGSERLGRRMERREGWFEWINSVHLGLNSLKAHPRHIWRVLGSSFGYQFVLLGAAACAAQALKIDEVGPTALMALFPAVLIVQVLPLGIGGLGIREGALVLFFGPLGVADERLIAFGFLVYFLTLSTSVVGLPSLIFGGRRSADDDEELDGWSDGSSDSDSESGSGPGRTAGGSMASAATSVLARPESEDPVGPDPSGADATAPDLAEPAQPAQLRADVAGPLSAAQKRKKHGLKWYVELGLIGGFYAVYSWIRNQFGSGQEGSAAAALRNAERVIGWQESLGLLVEEQIQGWFIDWTAFIQFWNLFYGFFHFAVTGFVLIYLYVKRPSRYAFWRTAGLITTAVALVGFAAFPLMPPRLMGDCGPFGGCQESGFVDTVLEVGGIWSFNSEGMAEISNQFAAMPSLHIGWALWSGIALMRTLQNRTGRILAALYPCATLFAIVVTGNHWILDAVGGAAAVGIGVLLAKVIHSAVSRGQSRPIVLNNDPGSGRVA